MGPGLTGYLIRRVLWAVPVLFIISVAVFWIVRAAPGDPVDSILGRDFYSEEQAEQLRDKYGYSDPLPVQYWKWLKNFSQGDLGISTRHRDFTANEIILPKMRISATLGIIALVITFGLGIPVGIYAALARGTILDPLMISTWLMIDAIPYFVMIPVIQWLLAIKLGLIGLGYEGLTSPNIIVPILLLSLPAVAGVARIMRASILSVIDEDYVRTARSKGLRESTVIFTHVARNAMLPMITVIGLSLPGLAGGSLFVELFFGIPGIARESLDAVLAPDFDVILALTMISSILFVVANILIDIAYAIIDPRVRLGEARG
ncbi:MAG: ABC transporter permease [Dehalococcoidia bacterium]|nr:ABC transporter permease [Dehalococcoidia bacterium]